jgi:hypothetical protein
METRTAEWSDVMESGPAARKRCPMTRCCAIALTAFVAVSLISCGEASREPARPAREKSSGQATAPSRVISSPPPSVNRQGRGIGISYEAAVAHLSKFFVMTKTTSDDGQERYMGRTSDGTAMLEIIGDKDDISEASLFLNIPNDDVGAAMRNGGFFDIFAKDIDPKWNDASAWVTNNLGHMSDSQTDAVEMIRGEKVFTLRLMKPLGMISISVRHREQKSGREGRRNLSP